MNLKVGEYYLSAGGEIIEINYFNTETFEDINENLYFENGECDGDAREFDLIAHIPKSLHLHILNEINSFYTDKDFMETVKSVWGNKKR